MKRPSFQFYPGDWRRDTALRSCSLEARGLWIELMAAMHDGEPYGHLAVAGVALTDSQVASIVGIALPRYRRLLQELRAAGVASVSEGGLLFSRRMVRDEEVREARAAGGARSLQNPNVPRPKGQGEGYPSDHPSGGSIRPSPAVAVAVASAKETTTTTPARRQADRCRAEIPEPYRPALEGALRSARNPDALAAELCMIADGQRGVAYSWEIIGRALHELAVAGAEVRSVTLAAFCRKAAEVPRETSGGPDKVAAEIERLERERAERLRRNA